MDSAVQNYLARLLWIGGGGIAILLLLIPVLPVESVLGLIYGYLLSFLFVLSNFFVVKRLNMDEHGEFLKVFFASLAIRFVLVLTCFATVLALLKIDQILFTVSFIISYIFHSIIEIIFINKILENR